MKDESFKVDNAKAMMRSPRDMKNFFFIHSKSREGRGKEDNSSDIQQLAAVFIQLVEQGRR